MGGGGGGGSLNLSFGTRCGYQTLGLQGLIVLLYSVHSENAEFMFLLPPSGTCFRSCFDKSGKQGASTVSSN